jgi:hypothetical protein
MQDEYTSTVLMMKYSDSIMDVNRRAKAIMGKPPSMEEITRAKKQMEITLLTPMEALAEIKKRVEK